MADAVSPPSEGPFARVEVQNVDFPALERAILKFWDDHGIFEKRKELNRGKPRWSFLDGPITANNPMGVHHAWGRTYKDAYNRYFAMTGHELRYQQGFDCQGLWVEVEVEKELGLKSKRDIENLVPGDPEASIDRFVTACKNRVNRFARVQSEQSIRLGMWMNWDRTDDDWAKKPDERKSYFTMAERNNYTIWSFLKKCHTKGMIYRGYDSMPWCGRCGVGISEMEMKEGYKLTEHKSVFVRFALKDRPGEYLLVWTTTPWTLPANVGAAVNSELTYLKVKIKGDVYYVSKGAFKLNRMETSEAGEPGDVSPPENASPTSGGLTSPGSPKRARRDWIDGVPHLSSIEQHFKSKGGKEGYEIVGEVKGADMLGWEYVGPFDDLPAQQHEFGFPEEVAKIVEQRRWCPPVTAAQSHRVISGGDDVTDTEGTGIVHTAPGCGQIDFAWGKENGLPPVAPIDDSGNFHAGFGPLAGRNAVDPKTADAVFEELKKKDALFVTERYVHRYPHCWRCKTELLYRLVDEWFINMGPKEEWSARSASGSDTARGASGPHYSFRHAIMKVVKNPDVKFLPESINGTARELDWLRNMGDWMISKKRYWGLALPIWVDEADPTQFEVIGSYEELKQRAVEGWTEFDGHTPHRPWVDKVKIRGQNGKLMSRIPDVGNPWLDAGIVAFSTMPADWYPADFITESFPGQFRNWFYALLALSTMMSDGAPPFRNLLGHGLVRDEQGKEMHKTAGNSIEFNAAAEELGADAMRWLYCRANPASNLNFGPETIREVRAKFIIKLWNCYGFFANYARLDGFNPAAPPVPVRDRADIDRWLLSDLQLLIKAAREAFESYNVMAFCLAAEEFVDAKLSNWYIRRNRDRFWSKNAELDETGKRDKLAAYQTLHTVLLDLCRLCAPVVPFLTEVMWLNLKAHPLQRVGFESVHLADYPVAEEALVDTELSQDMDAVLRIVSLGGAARNAAKQKVRQPLAELRISSGSEADRRAVERFPALITEELNIKKVTFHDSRFGKQPLLSMEYKLIPKLAAPKYGARFGEVQAALQAVAELDPSTGVIGLEEIGGVTVELSDGTRFGVAATDVLIKPKPREGWEGVAHRGLLVALDIRITPELKAEGMARDVIRFVQDARKDAKLDVADKIALYLGTDSEVLKAAITTHRDTIAAEVQAVQWFDALLTGDGVHTATAKVDGQSLTIMLRKG